MSRKAPSRDARLPPLFILFSYFIFSNNAFDLLFTKLQIVIIGLGAFIYYLVVEDGKGTWLEGCILMLCYLIFAAAAYFVERAPCRNLTAYSSSVTTLQPEHCSCVGLTITCRDANGPPGTEAETSHRVTRAHPWWRRACAHAENEEQAHGIVR